MIDNVLEALKELADACAPAPWRLSPPPCWPFIR